MRDLEQETRNKALVLEAFDALFNRRDFEAAEPSGIGQYYGKDGFDMLAHPKSILISPPDVAIEHLFSPYTDRKNAALSRRFEY